MEEKISIHGLWEKALAFMGNQDEMLVVGGKALAAVLGCFVIWAVFKRVFRIFRKRLEKYEFVKANENVLDILRQALSYALVLAVGMYLIEILRIPSIKNLFYAFMVILFAFPGKHIAKLALDNLQKKVASRTKTNIDDIVFDLARRFSGVIIYAGAVILALELVGINIMPLVAGASILGVAIGFAAKDTLSNLIAGILLLIDRPFEEGDRIEVWSAPKNSATWGDVVEIGLRATKIRTTDNIVVVIPNNEIMTRDIINYTAGSDSIRVRINIGVAYDADIARAKEIILDVADQADWIMKEPAPRVVVVNFGESSVDIQARVWIHNARKRIHTISYMTDAVKAAFDREGIEIPFPRRDIIIRHESKGPDKGETNGDT